MSKPVYALRQYKSKKLFDAGFYSQRIPFKDLYSLVDALKDKSLVEVLEYELKEDLELFECIHYAPISEEITTIAFFQTNRV